MSLWWSGSVLSHIWMSMRKKIKKIKKSTDYDSCIFLLISQAMQNKKFKILLCFTPETNIRLKVNCNWIFLFIFMFKNKKKEREQILNKVIAFLKHTEIGTDSLGTLGINFSKGTLPVKVNITPKIFSSKSNHPEFTYI